MLIGYSETQYRPRNYKLTDNLQFSKPTFLGIEVPLLDMVEVTNGDTVITTGSDGSGRIKAKVASVDSIGDGVIGCIALEIIEDPAFPLSNQEGFNVQRKHIQKVL